MIDVSKILTSMSEQDVRVSLDGDGLKVDAPTGMMTEDRISFMRRHRRDIINFLLAKEAERIHCIVLLGQPDPGDVNNDDPVTGKHIIRDVKTGGGWISIENGKIALRWCGDLPDVAKLIDRIRAARVAVVLAARHEDVEHDRLERDAIQNEADFDNATPPSNDVEA